MSNQGANVRLPGQLTDRQLDGKITNTRVDAGHRKDYLAEADYRDRIKQRRITVWVLIVGILTLLFTVGCFILGLITLLRQH